jgi:hypothetical protein
MLASVHAYSHTDDRQLTIAHYMTYLQAAAVKHITCKIMIFSLISINHVAVCIRCFLWNRLKHVDIAQSKKLDNICALGG